MIIEVDNYKNKIENYDPNRSEDFHIESGKLADKDFKYQLKTKKYRSIIFMAGGTASGKTEFAYTYLNKKYNLVYDGTFKNYDGFKPKLDKIKRYAKNKPSVKIILIIPENLTLSLGAFLKRERKMNMETFFSTQIDSKISVSKILLNTKFRVDIYFSSVEENKDKLLFKKVSNKIDRKFKASFLLEYVKIIKDLAVKNSIEIKKQ